MLSKMVLNMTRTEKTAFLAVGFGYNALAVTVSHLGYEFPWGYLFSNFFFICTIGSFIEEYFVDVRAAGSSTSPQSCRLQPRCT